VVKVAKQQDVILVVDQAVVAVYQAVCLAAVAVTGGLVLAEAMADLMVTVVVAVVVAMTTMLAHQDKTAEWL
jgi:hypothetical protein